MYTEERLQQIRETYVRDHNLASSGRSDLNVRDRGAFNVNAPDFTNYVEFSDMTPTDGK